MLALDLGIRRTDARDRGPDAARPAHRRPHRRRRLTSPCGAADLAPAAPRCMVGLGPWSSPRPRPRDRYAAFVARRVRRPWWAWTSTAPCRRSSTTRRRRTIHPDAAQVLVDLAEVVAAVAVITGRPARQALALGGLDEVGDAIGDHGKELLPLRPVRQRALDLDPSPDRSRRDRRTGSGDVPGRELPGVLRRHDAADAFVEEKGLAVAVHTRRLPDAAAAFERLLPGAARARRRVTTSGRAGSQRDRGPLARHGQGQRRAHPRRGALGRGRLPLRRRRPRRRRGLRGGRRPARPGPAHAAGLLRLRGAARPASSSPTSWSTAPTGCSTCCAGSPGRP